MKMFSLRAIFTVLEKCRVNARIVFYNKINRNPWITNGLINSINHKNTLYKKTKKNPNNISIIQEYKDYRNRLSELIKKVKEDYYKAQIDKNKNCPKNMWQCVKNIESKSVNNEINRIKLENGEITSNKQKISDLFNTFFTEMGGNLAKKIKPVKRKFPKTQTANSIFLEQTNQQEIMQIITELKPNKAPGLDTLRAETIKQIAGYITDPLEYIFNKSLNCGTFPRAFKTAIIKPLFKTGDRLDLHNYRPISLLSCLSKIYERIIKKRLSDYINRYHLLSGNQYGFQEGKSTQDAIAEVISKVYAAMDNSKPAICIFVDLAKAFDTVSHQDLLNTLENIGIRGNALNLLESYLQGRKQCVKIGDSVSSTKNVLFGVPQGTVLGPLLFNLYVNDIFNIPISGQIISFADDTVLIYKDENWQRLKDKIQEDLPTLLDFFASKLLTINIKKTKYVPNCLEHPHEQNACKHLVTCV